MLLRPIAVTAVAAAFSLGSMLPSVAAETASRDLPVAVRCAPHCWRPALKTSWQWKLASPPTAKQIRRNRYAMWDVDGFETSRVKVAALQERSAVVCYISAGSYEGWRPDAPTFPGAARLTKRTPNHATQGILGWTMDGWNERWLDIRGVQRPKSALASIMRQRVDMCAAKGFDGVEFDNVDAYANKSGFRLTAYDQRYYNAWLANLAHRRGLSALLKNDMAQIPTLLPYFDAAVNEQCWQYSECTVAQTGRYGYDQFVAAGKPVFGVEYGGNPSTFCPKANAQNFNWLQKSLSLGSARTACR